MRRTVTLGILLLSTAIATADTLDTPILGGQPTTLGEYPMVVSVEAGGGLCTGTLIDKEWVLTAAHCIQGVSVSGIRLRFGSTTAFSGGVVRMASMAIPKPGFSTNSLGKNDIGLVKLDMPITDIRPVAVNLDPAKAPIGLQVTQVGFGATSVGGGGAGVQYEVQQTTVSCMSWVGSNTDLLCFNQISGKGKCQGDSGGPSFAMIDGVFTQVGVTSFGDQNCAEFGADTRTDVEKPFLLQHVPQLECDGDEDCAAGKMCFNKKCILTPFTEGGLGAACTGAGECESMICADDGDHKYCSATCNVVNQDACPAGLECIDTGDGTGACWPIAEDTGCCDASGKGAQTGLLLFAFVGIVLRRKRRR